MPELPEVEIVRQSLEKKVRDKIIQKVLIKNRNLRFKIQSNFQKHLLKKKIKKIDRFSKYIIILLSAICFVIASKGFDILYLFLLADLFCCAFVLTIFFSFFNRDINEKTAYISIIIALVSGFLMFPFPDFSKSLLVGVIFPTDLFSPFIAQSLLFLSFLIATFLPAIILKIKFR